MLVLSRKTGQTIQIGEGISVTVTQVKGGTIRLGISAPPEVAIRRGELVPHEDLPDSISSVTRLPSLIHLDTPSGAVGEV